MNSPFRTRNIMHVIKKGFIDGGKGNNKPKFAGNHMSDDYVKSEKERGYSPSLKENKDMNIQKDELFEGNKDEKIGRKKTFDSPSTSKFAEKKDFKEKDKVFEDVGNDYIEYEQSSFIYYEYPLEGNNKHKKGMQDKMRENQKEKEDNEFDKNTYGKDTSFAEKRQKDKPTTESTDSKDTWDEKRL
jgi:hypothetical protein